MTVIGMPQCPRCEELKKTLGPDDVYLLFQEAPLAIRRRLLREHKDAKGIIHFPVILKEEDDGSIGRTAGRDHTDPLAE